MGNTIEKMLILCIAQGYQDVKFISFTKNVLKTYENIQEDVYTFNSLPTIPKKNQKKSAIKQNKTENKLTKYSFV